MIDTNTKKHTRAITHNTQTPSQTHTNKHKKTCTQTNKHADKYKSLVSHVIHNSTTFHFSSPNASLTVCSRLLPLASAYQRRAYFSSLYDQGVTARREEAG